MTTNRQWRVKTHPQPDQIIGEEHFDLVESGIPAIKDDEFLVRTLTLGTSPAQRGYVDPRKPDIVPVGDIMRGRGIGVVEASKHPDFQPGDWVNASMGWQEWSVQTLDRGPVQSMDVLSVQKVDSTLRPSTLHLGTLGSAAFAALYGIEDIGEISPGKTVVVSAAAGGVGSMACQIARVHDCRVVGIAGGEEKCAWVRSTVGCDAAIDYKNDDVAAALDRLCPDGIHIYFDNVGGPMLDDVLLRLAMHARVVICGYIATQYQPAKSPGPSNYVHLLGKRARMEGFVVWDNVARYPEFFAKLKRWYDDGKIVRDVEEVTEGIQTMPAALHSLFTGGNTGIRLVQVSPDPD